MVVDEVKRMRILVEVLKWPEDPVKLRELFKVSKALSLTRKVKDEKEESEVRQEESKVGRKNGRSLCVSHLFFFSGFLLISR